MLETSHDPWPIFASRFDYCFLMQTTWFQIEMARESDWKDSDLTKELESAMESQVSVHSLHIINNLSATLWTYRERIYRQLHDLAHLEDRAQWVINSRLGENRNEATPAQWNFRAESASRFSGSERSSPPLPGTPPNDIMDTSDDSDGGYTYSSSRVLAILLLPTPIHRRRLVMEFIQLVRLAPVRVSALLMDRLY
ncbi:hypothetical protein BDP27DRAFT_1363294 [Rhodocollybia butyracea]|uniref:Uncharacterized protein n=1 Tax=Rhodocollybia butyracea TaxID=206335 RepID=A0A9P5PP03_9AGAR|nr:hypothetical protein BDP27DRAFT_1363294 [Rhodocollybia butyracea]